MSDTSDSNTPKYKMVDGELVELTQEEIDEIEAERAAMMVPTDELPPEPEPKHGRRSKRS